MTSLGGVHQSDERDGFIGRRTSASMPRAVAINVGANTNAPGVRGPIHADGRFEFVPIPETEPLAERVPTYRDLDLDTEIPKAVLDSPVHLDPEFPEYPHGERYSYGDPHGVKARPLTELATGDFVFFYATLSVVEKRADWQASEWGAYLIGAFELACDPVTGVEYEDLTPAEREPFANNAHTKRETFDARVLLAGTPEESALYERAIPLSGRATGTDPNRLVTDLSSDSGRGPWWRRPLRFDETATEELLAVCENREYERCFGRTSERE